MLLFLVSNTINQDYIKNTNRVKSYAIINENAASRFTGGRGSVGTKGRPCNNKIIGNSSTPSLIMFHISASLLVPRMGPGKGNKGEERGERERERRRRGGENWTNKLKPGTALRERGKGEGGEQLKHIYTPANS